MDPYHNTVHADTSGLLLAALSPGFTKRSLRWNLGVYTSLISYYSHTISITDCGTRTLYYTSTSAICNPTRALVKMERVVNTEIIVEKIDKFKCYISRIGRQIGYSCATHSKVGLGVSFNRTNTEKNNPYWNPNPYLSTCLFFIGDPSKQFFLK